MIIEKKDDLREFRVALREWLCKNTPADWHARYREDPFGFFRWWMAELRSAGLATPTWPKAYGGADLGMSHQIILADEFARANAPTLSLSMYIVALTHVPATLLTWGTEEQKAKYLPTISRDGELWCQGFSEPGAGSDLASLRTRAVRDGDHYVINGQKVWSSFAHHARYCILLARTDTTVKKHAGITYFLLDMQAPGVDPRPIKQASGDSEFCELFLTDVKIPVADRVGEEGQGWLVAQSTLAAERGVYGFELNERFSYGIERFIRESLENNAPWLEDAQLRREFMTLFGEMQALRRLTRQGLRENHTPEGVASVTPAFVKLIGTTLHQKMANLQERIAGMASLAADVPGPTLDFMESFANTISAGTNEIMRNIIAERGLGMPR